MERMELRCAILIITIVVFLGGLLINPIEVSATAFIIDNATGGSCGQIEGLSWNFESKTCKLLRDFDDVNHLLLLQIASDGITLDGNGHKMRNALCADPQSCGGTAVRVSDVRDVLVVKILL